MATTNPGAVFQFPLLPDPPGDSKDVPLWLRRDFLPALNVALDEHLHLYPSGLSGELRVKTYTTASQPTPAVAGAGALVFVSDADNFQGSDGMTWTAFGAAGGGPPFATPNITLGTVAAPGAANSVIRSDSTVVAFDTTVPAALAGTASTGAIALAARRDHVHIFPPILQSLTNLKQLTFSDDGTNTFLASNFGNLTISPASGNSIILDPLAPLPAATTPSVTVKMQPQATGATGLQPQYAGVDMNAGAVRAWNVLMAHTKQLIGSSIRGFDMTTFSTIPTAGSDANNTMQGAFLTGPLILNANAGFLGVEALYLQGARRLASNPALTQGNTLVVESTTIGSSIQAMAYFKQRTAQQTATTRYGILIDPQNSGTSKRGISAITDPSIFGSVITGRLGPESAATMGGAIRIVDGVLFALSMAGIQAAVNDLPAAGGTVYILGNIITVDAAVTVPSNTTVWAHNTVLQRNAGFLGINIFKDSGSAISNVTIRGFTFDNNSLAVTADDIDFVGGATDVSIELNRWINLTNRTADLSRIQTSASKGARIDVRLNRVLGPGSQQVYNSFQVFDCDNVNIHNNTIDGWGAIKVEASLAALLLNWNVHDNIMKSVDQSNIFCRTQGAANVLGINIHGNTIVDAGKTGIVVNAVNATDTGSLRSVSIGGNTVRGYAVDLTDSGIVIGGVVTSGAYYCTNVTIIGNSIDGLKSDGTVSATSDRGILVGTGSQIVSVFGNTIRNAGRAGIGCTGQDIDITSNTIERCVIRDTTGTPPPPSQEGGIAIYGNGIYIPKNIKIANNISKNNGVNGTVKSYGITLCANGVGTYSDFQVHGNRCYDDQGTQTQDYGIVIGSVGVAGPDNIQIWGNDLRGNATGAYLKQGSSGNWVIYDNIETNGTAFDADTPSIPDGQIFKRSGTSVIGIDPSVLVGSQNASWVRPMLLGGM